MNFNPDTNKQAQEVIFSKKVNKINNPPLLNFSTQKDLRMVLDTKLDFNLFPKNVQSKVNKTQRLLCKLLPRESLVTI